MVMQCDRQEEDAASGRMRALRRKLGLDKEAISV